MNNKGIVLIVVVIVIALLGIVAIASTTYITEALRFNTTNIDQGKAFYMAQAGVMAAIVDYSDGDAWSPVQNVNVTGEFYYHVGEDMNFFRIDASSPTLFSGNRRLRNITLYNANASSNIVLDAITISWDTDGGETLTNIDFAGGSDEWIGSVSSGQSISLSYTFIAGSSYSLQLDWSVGDDLSGKTITAQFDFSDGSSRSANLLDFGSGGNDEFSITATGEVRTGAVVEARRTLSATYDVGTSEITSWEESLNHIIP